MKILLLLGCFVLFFTILLCVTAPLGALLISLAPPAEGVVNTGIAVGSALAAFGGTHQIAELIG